MRPRGGLFRFFLARVARLAIGGKFFAYFWFRSYFVTSNKEIDPVLDINALPRESQRSLRIPFTSLACRKRRDCSKLS